MAACSISDINLERNIRMSGEQPYKFRFIFVEIPNYIIYYSTPLNTFFSSNQNIFLVKIPVKNIDFYNQPSQREN